MLGALCLLWWTLTIVTMTKYLFIVLSANDHGEGEPSDFPLSPRLHHHAGRPCSSLQSCQCCRCVSDCRRAHPRRHVRRVLAPLPFRADQPLRP